MSTATPYRFAGPAGDFTVIERGTGRTLGAVRKDVTGRNLWHAYSTAGALIGAEFPTRAKAADYLVEQAERAVPTTTPRTVDDPRVTTDPAGRAILLAAAARLDALPTDDEDETRAEMDDEPGRARCVHVSGRRRRYQCGAPADVVAADGRPLCSTHDGWERQNSDSTRGPSSPLVADDELATYRSTGGGAYELTAPRPTPTDAERERAGRAAARYLSDELPDLPRVVADALAEYRAELAALLAPALIAYDAEADDWTEANEEAHDDPSVKDCERHSNALENVAHEFAAVVRGLVEPATNPPADPSGAVELPAAAVDVRDAVLIELDTASTTGDATTPGDFAADVIAALMRRYDVGRDD